MTSPTPSTIREYEVGARSTDVFGRVLCSARTHHFIVDGPVQNGCPGEELTPVELFLAGVAACGVELLHVIARDQDAPLDRVAVRVRGIADRARQSRADITTLTTLRMHVALSGTDDASAAALIEAFKRR